MNATLPTGEDNEILGALEAGLREQLGGNVRVDRMSRRLSDYRSSFAIQELDVVLDDGRRLAVMFKDLSPQSLLEVARRTRPQHLYDPRREIGVYRRVLSSLALGTATCYATHVDLQRDRYWLFVEKVNGVELYQVGELSVWEGVARWLARFHACSRTLADKVPEARLLPWGLDDYRRSLSRARECIAQCHSREADESRAIEQIAQDYERTIERLLAMPVTIIHGDFFASNVLVQQANGRTRVCPIDWETAGVGPGLIDLAALVAGEWPEHQRTAIATAYFESLVEAGVLKRGKLADFQRDLACCRLQLAIHIIGRSAEWEPPAEHKRDWLAEASLLAETLQA